MTKRMAGEHLEIFDEIQQRTLTENGYEISYEVAALVTLIHDIRSFSALLQDFYLLVRER